MGVSYGLAQLSVEDSVSSAVHTLLHPQDQLNEGYHTSPTPRFDLPGKSTPTTNFELLDGMVDDQLEYFGHAAIVSASTVVRGYQDADGTPKPDSHGEVQASTSHKVNVLTDSSPGTKLPYQIDTAAAPAIRPGVTQSSQTSFDRSYFDWTRIPMSPSLPSHILFVRSVNWALTDLGPIEHWSPTLRAMSNLVMASPHPTAMYWGNNNTAIYNEAYVQLAGQKHPALMGCSYQVAWSDIWPLVKDVFVNARKTGQATMKSDDCLFMRRSGFLEETYFSWSIVPLVDENGQVVGLYNPAFELTRRKIAERRMITLREIGERTATAREVKDFWGQVLEGLQYNEYDTPFVLLYSVSEYVGSDDSLLHSEQCFLEGALGVRQGHQAAPAHIDLRSGSSGFGPVFRKAMSTDYPVLLETENGSLSFDLIRGIDWRGFGDPCRAAVVCSIKPTTRDSILGFLVIRINPRRPYDDDYNLFVQLLSRQLGTSLASVVLFEEEIRRSQRAARIAALDRIKLSEQLAARTQEAVESETRFTRMAELSPVGMIIADSTGRINYCNETWYKLSGRSRDDTNTGDWIDSVTEQDQDSVHNLWTTLLKKQVPMTAEFRFKTPWKDRNGNKSETWVLASAYPEKDQDGVLKSVFGSVTDISQQKWAEDFQKRRMEEAVEMKRQQENFNDMTSHEMRNPLSAILQCADGISASLTFPHAQKREDFTEGPDWGQGQKVFIHFAVRDTVRGLDESEKKLLFQRFSQASPRTHVQYGGSGLGLFIFTGTCRSPGWRDRCLLRKRQRQHIGVLREARKSTAPADALEQCTLPNSREAEHSQTTRNIALRNSMKKDHIKVLIVEDNLVNQRVLQQQLRNLGYTVYVANHGEETLNQLKQSTYWQGHEKDGTSINVILMDVEMPVMDGLTCARKIRELEESGDLVRHIPIIAVTANARVE